MIEGAGGLSKFLVESPDLEVVNRIVCLNDFAVSKIPNLKTDFPSLRNSSEAVVVVPESGVRNGSGLGSGLSSRQGYDGESVSSDGSFLSSNCGPRVVSSTAQLAPIRLDRDPKNNTTYVAQETCRGETEKACGMTESPMECFVPDRPPASSTMWYSGRTDEYDDGYDRERLDDPEDDELSLDELSPDEYEFLRRNREFVPSPEASRVTTDDECEDTDFMKPPSRLESVASLATFSEYERVTPPSVQATCGLHDFSGQCQEVVGLNGDTTTENGVAPVVSAADKTYILELEDKQEELKDVIIKERDDYARLQRETDERVNTLQMESAKSMSVSDEHINSLHRDYGRLKQASDTTIANLRAEVDNMKHEIQVSICILPLFIAFCLSSLFLSIFLT